MESHAHTLYVILQGEFALYCSKAEADHDTLNIVAPYIPDDQHGYKHVYKAGPWDSDWEKIGELPYTPLYLHHAFGDRKQGATARHHPRAIPENNPDLLMTCGPEAPDPSNARVHIIAPIPLALLSGLAETNNTATITYTQNGGQATKLAPPHAAVILILVYKWYGDRPYLSDYEETSVWKPGGPDEYQSIHIYASSPTEEDNPQHAKDAFKAAAALLGETASIDWPDSAAFRRIAATPPAGLSWAQVNLFLSEVIELHGSRLLDEDFVDIHDLPWWEPTKGGQSTNCGPITGGGGGG